MITRHHIALTILSTLILCNAVVPDSPFTILVICLGAGAGTILPDIQMKKPRYLQARTVPWLIARFSSILCTPLICGFYRHLTGITCDPLDKRLTHSVPGIFLLWSILAVLVLLPASVLLHETLPAMPVAFLAGLMLGLILHLVEDLCTKKGITPLFPFSSAKLSGSIRPCDTTDRRIAQFHYYDCAVAGIVLGFQYLGAGSSLSAPAICIFGLCSCLGMMVFSSDVGIVWEDPRDAVPPVVPPQVMLDPVSFYGLPRYPLAGLMMGVYYYRKI